MPVEPPPHTPNRIAGARLIAFGVMILTLLGGCVLWVAPAAKLSDAIGGSLIFALPFLIAGIVLLFRK